MTWDNVLALFDTIHLTYSGKRLKKIYKWVPFQPTAEWVEENVVLASDTSPIAGNMRLKFTPHLIEMFSDYDRPEVWQQVLMTSSQVAKTSYLFCVTAKSLDTDPAPAQLMIPTATGIPRYLTKKLNPFMSGVKKLKAKVQDYTTTEKIRNRGAEIRVAGGGLSVTGSSRGERKSLSVKHFYADEIAEFEEGAVSEAVERSKAFSRFFRKVVLASTMEDSNDEINRNFNDCETQKEFEVQCPNCSEFTYFGADHLKFMTIDDYAKENGLESDKIPMNAYKSVALTTVHLECPECHHKITTPMRDKQILSKKIRWNIIQGASEGVSIGYKANALAMYFTTLESIAELLINAESSQHKLALLDKIYRGYFNEFYQQETEALDKNDILLLSNGLLEKTIPDDTAKVYLTIDTQKYGFWFQITAFQYGFRANAVLHGFVETFDELEILMGMRFKDTKGRSYMVDKTTIDRLGIEERTVEVDAWIEHLLVNEGMEGLIYPTMGFQNEAAGRLWYYSEITKDLTTGDRRKTPLRAIRINNTLTKNELNEMIQRSIAKAKGEEMAKSYKTRLFFINQTIVNEAEAKIENGEKSIATDYERQITSEEYVYKINKKTGQVATRKTWEKRTSSIDNHILDVNVQAVTCAIIDNIAVMQQPLSSDFDNALNDLLPA